MARFIRVLTYVTETKALEMGLNPEPEQIELLFNPDHVVFIQAEEQFHTKGSFVSLSNGEGFFCGLAPSELSQLIDRGQHPSTN